MTIAEIIIFSIIMIYTVFATFYIVVRQLTSKDRVEMGNNVFTNMIVSLASTLGLYFLMSFLYLDPWHMFTSFLQYMFLLPSYVNILSESTAFLFKV